MILPWLLFWALVHRGSSKSLGPNFPGLLSTVKRDVRTMACRMGVGDQDMIAPTKARGFAEDSQLEEGCPLVCLHMVGSCLLPGSGYPLYFSCLSPSSYFSLFPTQKLHKPAEHLIGGGSSFVHAVGKFTNNLSFVSCVCSHFCDLWRSPYTWGYAGYQRQEAHYWCGTARESFRWVRHGSSDVGEAPRVITGSGSRTASL